MTTLQYLLDRQQLADNMAVYCRAIDRRDFASVQRLYHPDAIHDHGGLFRGNAEELVAWLRQAMTGVVTQHFIGNTLIAIDGDCAEAETYTINTHVLADGSEYIGGGRYLDHYVRNEAGWQILRRSRLIDWSHDRRSGPSATAAQITGGTLDRSDKSWSELPLLARRFSAS